MLAFLYFSFLISLLPLFLFSSSPWSSSSSPSSFFSLLSAFPQMMIMMMMMMISVFLSRRYFEELVGACAHAFNAHQKMMMWMLVWRPPFAALLFHTFFHSGPTKAALANEKMIFASFLLYFSSRSSFCCIRSVSTFLNIHHQKNNTEEENVLCSLISSRSKFHQRMTNALFNLARKGSIAISICMPMTFLC